MRTLEQILRDKAKATRDVEFANQKLVRINEELRELQQAVTRAAA